ncbi:MAG: hypothetical protein V2I43_08940, partial [Parvularcula sp.]|nr:hypothetical protein [Parvularcula sp.]
GFPWTLAETLQLGSGEIVEDLALTLTLARRGIPIEHVGEILVISEFPTDDGAATVQRARWEHGSLRLLRLGGIPLLGDAAKRMSPSMAMLALDIMIPPLTVFVAALLVTGLVSAAALFVGVIWPFALTAAAGCAFAIAVLVTWWRFGREALPAGTLGALVPFLVSKLAVYGRMGRSSTKAWTRTPRDHEKKELP